MGTETCEQMLEAWYPASAIILCEHKRHCATEMCKAAINQACRTAAGMPHPLISAGGVGTVA